MSVGYVVKNVHHPDGRSSAAVRTTRACIAAQARPDEVRHAVIQVEQNGVTSTNARARGTHEIGHVKGEAKQGCGSRETPGAKMKQGALRG